MSNTAVRYLTMRSIQRDLEKLSTDFPLLVGESTRPFCWSFDREATMDIIPALDLPAALTFELAKAYLTPMLPPRALSHLKPHFNEAHRTLSRESNPLGQWPNRVRVINRGLSGSRPAIDADVLETVTEALLREYQCKLTYQARNWPEPGDIIVHPLGLIFRDPNVYLIGTIEGAPRTFDRCPLPCVCMFYALLVGSQLLGFECQKTGHRRFRGLPVIVSASTDCVVVE